MIYKESNMYAQNRLIQAILFLRAFFIFIVLRRLIKDAKKIFIDMVLILKSFIPCCIYERSRVKSMNEQLFYVSDIIDDLAHYVDMYLKKVIKNAKHHYYRNKSKIKKYGIVFVDWEKYDGDFEYEEEGFEAVLCQYIEIKGISIPIYNQNLACALMKLTETQRLVLVQNVVLKITLKKIANDLKISERMATKHKHNAIEKIKKEMKKYENAST